MKRRPNGSGTLFRRNGWYYVKMMKNGHAVCKSTKTTDRREAEKFLATMEIGSELPDKTRLAVISEMLKSDRRDPTIDEAIDVYLKHPKNASQSQSASATDSGRWRFFVRWMHGYQKERSRVNCPAAHPEIRRLSEVTPSVATEFFRFAITCTSPNTLNKYLRVYRRIWEFNECENNPWKDFKKIREQPRRRRALTRDEVAKIIGEAEGELKLMFALGVYTGLRMTDCARLQWSNLNHNRTTITTTPHKTQSSSGVSVTIPVHPELSKIIKACANRNHASITPKLAAMSEWELSDIVKAHFTKCGLDEQYEADGYRRKTAVVGFHSLRSTFITMAAEVGAPLAMIQSIVGHLSPEMTQLYYRADVEHARKFIDRI